MNGGLGTLFRALCLAITGFLLLSAAPPLAQAAALKVVYVEFPPFSSSGAGGKAEGTLIDMLRKVATDAGDQVDFEAAPARRAFQGLAAGDFDLFMGIKTAADLQGTTLASTTVIEKLELRAYGIGEQPAIKAKEDLAGKSVVVLTGYSYGGWRPYFENAANAVQLVEARTADQALSLLKAGRGGLLLQYTQPMDKALAGKPLPELKSNVISSIDLHFVVSRKAPEAAAVLARLEGSFNKLKAAGALD